MLIIYCFFCLFCCFLLICCCFYCFHKPVSLSLQSTVLLASLVAQSPFARSTLSYCGGKPPEPPTELRSVSTKETCSFVDDLLRRCGDSPRSPVENERACFAGSFSPAPLRGGVCCKVATLHGGTSSSVRSSEQFSFFELFAVAHWDGETYGFPPPFPPSAYRGLPHSCPILVTVVASLLL